MEYLVESHLGGYYVSNSDPDIIEKYCDECGDHDWIILSWSEGQKYNTLKKYFSSIKINKKGINEHLLEGLSKSELIDYALYKYQDDIDMISYLFERKIISPHEMTELIRNVKCFQHQQIELIIEVYSNEKCKVLKK